MIHNLITRICAYCLSTLCFAGGALPAHAYEPMQSLSSEEFVQQRSNGDFSSDWSHTDQYDFSSRTELPVTLQGVDFADNGLALVKFTMDLPQEVMARANWRADHLFYAVLQLGDDVKRKGITSRHFGQGKAVVLRGWPPTERNVSGSLMLVEEIRFGDGKRYRFHDDNPNINKPLN